MYGLYTVTLAESEGSPLARRHQVQRPTGFHRNDVAMTVSHSQILRTPQPSVPVRTNTDDPRLPGVPLGLEDAKVVGDLVALEHLERHDERVREQVRVDGRVEDVDRAVVRS